MFGVDIISAVQSVLSIFIVYMRSSLFCAYCLVGGGAVCVLSWKCVGTNSVWLV